MRKVIGLFSLLILASCGGDYIPKPAGYFRIGLPEKEYTLIDSTGCDYQFEMNKSASFQPVRNRACWADIKYPSLKATIQLTYMDLTTRDLNKVLQEGQRMAYSHTKVAEGMQEQFFTNPEKNVHGLLYEMRGNVATSTQFYMTDSTDHFLRGVLYFYSSPNPDSLKDVNNFMREEIVKIIETLEWKNG